jgi:hypothetical protein
VERPATTRHRCTQVNAKLTKISTIILAMYT